MIFFFWMLLSSHKINWFFFEQSNALQGRKTHMFLFGNARPKSNARANLKQKNPLWPMKLYAITACFI